MHHKEPLLGLRLPVRVVVVIIVVAVTMLMLVSAAAASAVMLMVLLLLLVVLLSVVVVTAAAAGAQIGSTKGKVECSAGAAVAGGRILVGLYHRSGLLANVVVAGKAQMAVLLLEQPGHRVQQVLVVCVGLIPWETAGC